ncbi:hypothetical protein R77555_04349 [Ralstonia mannitolilytica]|uniref:hypothetical protein n=1 Tax=Ralstonia mannitolilytica TaxID=105219 RepID=UPI0028F5254F|nr:hypothetical protein [Ralstonia mannitolilytica]CAJ0805745.1 hypothetical protein R77555_04349 [Ralstonia mannitolilytica]
MRKSRFVDIARAVAGLIAATLAIAASAAAPFDEMSGQLERIASCDVSMFPVNKRGEVILAGFVRDLAGAGVRSRHTGTPPEDQTTYILPRAIKVFGQPVTRIDNLNPPFVMIEFDLSADELLANGILVLGVVIPLIGCSKEADNAQSADPSIVAMRVANSLKPYPECQMRAQVLRSFATSGQISEYERAVRVRSFISKIPRRCLAD